MLGSTSNNTKRQKLYLIVNYPKFAFVATHFMASGTIRSYLTANDMNSVIYC